MNSINEIQLTAYALGELSASERQQIEAQLQHNPAQQATVAEIQAMAVQLAAELKNDPALSLSDEQRQAIFQAPAQGAGRRMRFPWRKVTGFAAVAAAVTLVFGGAFWASTHSLNEKILLSENEHGEVAVNNDDAYIESTILCDELSPLEELADPVATTYDLPGESEPVAEPEIVDFCSAPAKDVAKLSCEILSSSAVGYCKRSSVPFGNTICESPVIRNDRTETESYAPIQGNPFKRIADEPLSTFSIDVDTASYANIRRFLRTGQMPPPDAVRIEEMINYFSYDYAPAKGEAPFAVHIESAACPWNKAHPLVKIGLKGKDLDAESRPPCNLVFLIDVSGSMNIDNKLPLVKKSLQLLAKQLSPQDRVSIVVYAGAAGLVLPSTACDHLPPIDSAIENLQAGGSTAGGEGIRLAYDEALKNLQPDGNNRVILCTDGDFNVGITDSNELSTFIAERAKKGIFLTILGFGMGNYKDDRLETLADKGNGNYAYIDTFSEARKNLAEQAAGTLFTIAKDVKLQIEFNPAHFDSYRLLGYENRILAKEDFNNDKKDAGELGAGHTVTAFYELVPIGSESSPGVDSLKYQAPEPASPVVPSAPSVNDNPEWLTVKLRYKLPRESQSTKIEIPYVGSFAAFEDASPDFRFAAGVAAGGLLMRQDPAAGTLTYPDVIRWTAAATGADPNGYRREYIQLLHDAAALSP